MFVQRYFDIFSYPLLPVEQEILRLKEERGEAEAMDVSLWTVREERQTIAYRKWRKALRVGRWLAMMPYVQMVAVCNNLAYDNATDESDIDLFIVTTSKRVWAARFFVSGFLALLRLRPTRRTTRDKICTSFFVSTDHLNISNLQLAASSQQLGAPADPYLLFWTATLYPIYDRGGVYERFWNANAWIKEYLPNAVPVIPHPWRTVRPALSPRFPESIFGAWFERFVKRIQMRAFPKNIRELMNKDTRVVVTDKVLKFHTNDRREEYRYHFYAESH
ncbi:hypothetical protein HY629_02675 [Candidatus Uhrbacteria bacterium]|nr:hypothetical protein [Candidatus Uhrbacteria bacterium]